MIAAITAMAIASAPRSARAADPQQGRADALFAEGRDLLEKGRFAEACPKLKESESLAPAVGTLLNLGYCWEQVGRMRSAMDSYAEAEVLAATANDTKRAAFAKERFAAVEKKAPRLVLRVAPQDAQDVALTRNGAPVPKTDINQPIPVDPEDYVLTASAHGYQTWKGAVVVRGDAAVVTIVVPQLLPEAASAASAGSTITPRRIGAIALGGVGALALGAGIAAALTAKSRYDDAAPHCDDTGCDATGVAIQEGAAAQGNVATALVAIGTLTAAAGVYLWIVGAPEPSTKKAGAPAPPSSPRAGARLELSGLGAGIGGLF